VFFFAQFVNEKKWFINIFFSFYAFRNQGGRITYITAHTLACVVKIKKNHHKKNKENDGICITCIEDTLILFLAREGCKRGLQPQIKIFHVSIINTHSGVFFPFLSLIIKDAQSFLQGFNFLLASCHPVFVTHTRVHAPRLDGIEVFRRRVQLFLRALQIFYGLI